MYSARRCHFTQYAYLDDNGVWQNAATPSSDVTNGVDYLAASGDASWSLSGSGPLNSYAYGASGSNEIYGNSGSGTGSTASGSGSNSYDYQEFFSYSPASGGAWTPQSGSGSASGNGWASFSFSASGGYSALDSNWGVAAGGMVPAISGKSSGYSGTVNASGDAYASYGYSTQSTFTSSSGWTSTGSESGTASGGTSTSFSASAPFANSDGPGNFISGTITAGGSDWGTYDYNEDRNLSWSSTGAVWSPTSGSGESSGGANANWGYSADNGSWTDGATSGTWGESGGETYGMNYSASASVSSSTGQWVQNGSGSNAGDASATAGYSFWYTGGASGSGGGGAAYSYDDGPLTSTLNGGDNWSIGGNPTGPTGPTQTSYSSPSDEPGSVGEMVTADGLTVPGSFENNNLVYLPEAVGPAAIDWVMSSWVEPESTPSPGSVVDQSAPVPSLPSLSPAASLVDTVPGMGNVANPGYAGTTGPANKPAQTAFANGNIPVRRAASHRRRFRTRTRSLGSMLSRMSSP